MKESILILAVLIITILSCRKTPMPIEADCIVLETDELFSSSGFLLFLPTGPSYSGFSINPNNGNEIIYPANQPGSKDLVRYNMETQVKEVLLEGRSIGSLRWGRKDWILMTISEGIFVNAWKIKSTGDSLTQLTSSGNIFYPRWNLSGDKFTAYIAHQDSDVFGIYTETGIPIDTVSAGIEGHGSWSNENDFIFADGDKLIYGNLETEMPDTIFITGNKQISGVDWISPDEVIWTTEEGIFKTNIATEITQKLIETCNSRFYSRPVYSPTNNRVVLNKLERIKEGDVGGREEPNLVSINVDGTDERIILIEE